MTHPYFLLQLFLGGNLDADCLMGNFECFDNIGFSTFISVGNKVDVSGNDLIQYWAEDPKTDVILLYLESFGNPRRFARLARRIGLGQRPRRLAREIAVGFRDH